MIAFPFLDAIFVSAPPLFLDTTPAITALAASSNTLYVFKN
jgi:hypothetical protein